MKIVSSGRVLNSSEFYRKKKKGRRVYLILSCVGLVLAFSLFVYMSRLEKFLIKEVSVPGEDIVGKEEIRRVAQKTIEGNYLWLIPRANFVLFPRGAIKENLSKEFPRLKSIKLDLDNTSTLVVTVSERKPFALYCTESGGCFFLDEEGLIFSSSPSFSGGTVYFKYTTEKPIGHPLGERLLTQDMFKSLSKFIDNLKTIGIDSIGVEIGDEEYKLVLSTGGKIIWRQSDDLTHIRSNLEAFLSSEAISADKEFLNKIESLDLRVENKVFYRFK